MSKKSREWKAILKRHNFYNGGNASSKDMCLKTYRTRNKWVNKSKHKLRKYKYETSNFGLTVKIGSLL